jgi:guanyl-specific ribonuclease Sa
VPFASVGGKRPTSASRILIALIFVGLGLYISWRNVPPPAQKGVAKPPDAKPEEVAAESASAPQEAKALSGKQVQTKISCVIVRDQDGQEVFRGTVDVGPTLKRIGRGEKLRFSHDGAVFENRERKLPKKPGGYYHEYVHPTPRLDGPGPQRIVTGEAGEIYYTHDHYRSFQRLDKGRP